MKIGYARISTADQSLDLQVVKTYKQILVFFGLFQVIDADNSSLKVINASSNANNSS